MAEEPLKLPGHGKTDIQCATKGHLQTHKYGDVILHYWETRLHNRGCRLMNSVHGLSVSLLIWRNEKNNKYIHSNTGRKSSYTLSELSSGVTL